MGHHHLRTRQRRRPVQEQSDRDAAPVQRQVSYQRTEALRQRQRHDFVHDYPSRAARRIRARCVLHGHARRALGRHSRRNSHTRLGRARHDRDAKPRHGLQGHARHSRSMARQRSETARPRTCGQTGGASVHGGHRGRRGRGDGTGARSGASKAGLHAPVRAGGVVARGDGSMADSAGL